MSMSISYEGTGRTSQKARTREALIAATRTLLARGTTPTVEETASEAAISRATAYRYFPNQRALLAAVYPEIEATSLLGPDPPEDVEARLDAVVMRILENTLESEPELRAMLRLSLDPESPEPRQTPLRKGRRIIWVEDALAPLRGQMAKVDFDRLVYAIAAAVGIDALVWMTDVAGLSRAQATDLMRWSARALLRSAAED
jgi:AcrR family transcriptional regulator